MGDEGPRPGRAVDPGGAHDPGAHDPAAQGTGARRDAEVQETAAPRRRAFARRGLVAAALSVVVALAVSAFATAGSATVDVDQRFVEAATTRGYAIPDDRRALTVSAARKICDRKDDHTTTAQRRATRLSTAEIAAVEQAFGGDVRGFTDLALTTYCPK